MVVGLVTRKSRCAEGVLDMRPAPVHLCTCFHMFKPPRGDIQHVVVERFTRTKYVEERLSNMRLALVKLGVFSRVQATQGDI